MTTLVTGATGSVGRYVLQGLLDAGRPVRAAVTGAPDMEHVHGGDTVAFDFAEPGMFAKALADVDRVFLMRPPAISDVKRYIRPFIHAMADSHVEQVVFLSLMGVNRIMPHWQIERDLETAGLPHTFVRPAFFTQNLSAAYRDDIANQGRIRLPAGAGRTAFIDTRDIAEVIVLALCDPRTHAWHAYTITGPRSWTYDEVTALLSRELDRPITYDRVGFLRYRAELRAQGRPAAYVRVQLLINAIARLGLAGKTTDTFRTVTGHDPIALPDSIHYLRDTWQPAR